jgi:hypothetical protein
LMLCTDINITETTYSCQFQYVFGNQYVIAVKVQISLANIPVTVQLWI